MKKQMVVVASGLIKNRLDLYAVLTAVGIHTADGLRK